LMVGVDLVEVGRIRDAASRFGDRFLKRIFTRRELEYCMGRRDPYPHLAARWAAKEAFVKALGTGFARGIKWKDVELLPGGDRPYLVLGGRASELLGERRAEVSISHTDSYAVAVVLIFPR